DQLQVLDVALVDLVERAVPPGLIVAAMDQPILGLGRPHHLVGHRDEVRDGALRARGSGRPLGLPRPAEGNKQGDTQERSADGVSHRTLPWSQQGPVEKEIFVEAVMRFKAAVDVSGARTAEIGVAEQPRVSDILRSHDAPTTPGAAGALSL